MRFINRIAQTNVLWFSFIATVLCTVAFQVIVQQHGLVMLDAIASQVQVHAALAAMSEHQHHLHAWMTGTLDVIYPAVYGALFIGSAYKFFPSKAFLLSLPAMICIPVDLIEGVFQIAVLTGTADWTELKEFLTPLKQWLFIAGIIITIGGWLKWSYQKLRA